MILRGFSVLLHPSFNTKLFEQIDHDRKISTRPGIKPKTSTKYAVDLSVLTCGSGKLSLSIDEPEHKLTYILLNNIVDGLI